VILYDHTGQHKLRGAVYVSQPGDLVSVMRRNLDAGREGFRVVYQPPAIISRDIKSNPLHDHFRAVCEAAYLVAGVVLAVDEIDSYCTSKYGDGRMPPELYAIAHFGRHAPGTGFSGGKRRGMALLFTARIPTTVARGLASQASEFRLFHEDDGEYLDYFRRGALRNKENTERLRTLEKYQYLRVLKDWSEPMELRGGARKVSQ
jgi:hypothetical protein